MDAPLDIMKFLTLLTVKSVMICVVNVTMEHNVRNVNTKQEMQIKNANAFLATLIQEWMNAIFFLELALVPIQFFSQQ